MNLKAYLSADQLEAINQRAEQLVSTLSGEPMPDNEVERAVSVIESITREPVGHVCWALDIIQEVYENDVLLRVQAEETENLIEQSL